MRMSQSQQVAFDTLAQSPTHIKTISVSRNGIAVRFKTQHTVTFNNRKIVCR